MTGLGSKLKTGWQNLIFTLITHIITKAKINFLNELIILFHLV